MLGFISRRGFREPQISGPRREEVNALPQVPKFLGFLPKTPLAAWTALTAGGTGTREAPTWLLGLGCV